MLVPRWEESGLRSIASDSAAGMSAATSRAARTRSWSAQAKKLKGREAAVLAAVSGVKTTRLGPLLLDGDHSAICWRFEFTAKDGKVRSMEEVAWQTWRGEELVEERFFYDPQQMAR